MAETVQHQRELFQQKTVAYWAATIDACGRNCKALWSKLYNRIPMATSSYLPTTSHTILRYNKDRPHPVSTASSPLPLINGHIIDQALSSLAPVTADEVMMILQQSPVNQAV